MKLVERIGLWLCARGYHARTVWRNKATTDAAFIAAGSVAREMFVAGGMLDLATFIGDCSRCGKPLSWASFDPSRSQRRGEP